MNKKKLKALADARTSNDLRLVEYRDFLAINISGTTCICPDDCTPCNSSCIFFYIEKHKPIPKEDKEATYIVKISCRSVALNLIVGL